MWPSSSGLPRTSAPTAKNERRFVFVGWCWRQQFPRKSERRRHWGVSQASATGAWGSKPRCGLNSAVFFYRLAMLSITLFTACSCERKWANATCLTSVSIKNRTYLLQILVSIQALPYCPTLWHTLNQNAGGESLPSGKHSKKPRKRKRARSHDLAPKQR